jgi:hypothetical protein
MLIPVTADGKIRTVGNKISECCCCPPSNRPSTLDFSVTVPAPNGWNTTQAGLDMFKGDCQWTAGNGWHANNWANNCYDNICHDTNAGCENIAEACKCGWRGRWIDPSGAHVQLILTYVVGDDVMTPDGWWLLVGVSNTSLACFWGGCISSQSYYGVWLGSDDSIFTSDLSLLLSLPTLGGGICSSDPIDFNITFHP